ncbi:MAG: YdcF family protein [Cyclobacteriaceae bacterium]|nr:YdcF family protein [Cyclobacteriaceae bacterium]MDH4295184.1 YdcF family protein [Cyclobacteriaceae bacterium]MDH5250511.1 YdcF family protein [Cyclobacteriaceae bacterium]
MRWLKKIVFAGIIAFLLLIVTSNAWIVWSTADKVFSDQSLLPDHRVALVLGTSNKTVSGGANPYFEKRMETAAKLYEMGKIDHIIVSGDNRSRYYNEPMEMQKALIKLGVPASVITLDFAGLRTLDSIVRCKEIFGQHRITIITQSFHSYRALFISKYYDIEAVAMVTDETDVEYSFKVRLREYFARTKAILDLYLLKTSPRFLGEKEQIEIFSGR